jgi:hypothetical protein
VNKNLLVALAILFSAAAGRATAPLVESRTIKETLTFPAGEGRRMLLVDNINGKVVVTGEERADVAVVILETIEAKNAEGLARAKREAKLDRTPGPGRTVRLYADGPWRCGEKNGESGSCKGSSNLPYEVRYDLELHVPKDLDLDVSTVNGGDLEIRGVEPRTFDIANVNGGVAAVGLTGAGEIATVNGDLTAHFRANPTGPCRFASVNGELDLGLRPGAGAEVATETVNGEIYSDFPVAPGAAKPVQVETGSGGRKVYKSSNPTFRIGSGGVALELETVNGDIVVRDLGASR